MSLFELWRSKRIATSVVYGRYTLTITICLACAQAIQEAPRPDTTVAESVPPDTATKDLAELPRITPWSPGDSVRDMPDLRETISPDPGAMYLHFIDVGSGTATLLEFSCAAVLVNAGGRNATDTALVSYLTRFFDRRLDLGDRLAGVIITGHGPQVSAGLRPLMARFRVGHFTADVGELSALEDESLRWMRDYVDRADHGIEVYVPDLPRLSLTPGITNRTIDPVECDEVDPTIRIVRRSDSSETLSEIHVFAVRIEFGAAAIVVPVDPHDIDIGTLEPYYRYRRTPLTGSVNIRVTREGIFQLVKP